MAQLVIPETVDTGHTDGNCIYAPAALEGSPIESPNIKINNQQVKFYTSATPPADITGDKITKVNPLIPAPCAPGKRVLVPKNNTNVFFNNQLPTIVGDVCQTITGIERPLVGPFGPSTVVIGTKS